MNFGRVGFVMEGDWSAAVTYDTLSVVLYEGAVYAAKRMSAGSEPSTHPADWMLWVGSPVVSAEQTEAGYDLTISNGDGTTSVVHLLNGQITEAELTSALSGLREAFNANIAEGYSSSSVYSEGDYCLYNNVLYRCTADILTPEAWDSDHWEAASLADDVQDLSENLYNNKVDAITSNASGEIVTIADGGDDLPVKNLSVSLLPVQDLHGQDAPYPPGGGANKIGIADGVDFTLKGIRYRVEDGSLYLDGTAIGETSSNDSAFKNAFSFVLGAGTYYFSRGSYGSAVYLKSESGTLVTNNGSFTLAEQTTVWFGFYMYNVTFSNVQVPLSIVLGSNPPSSYSPFSNICPISGWTGVEVYQAKKNLFDQDNAGWITRKYINASGVVGNNGQYKYTDEYTPVNANTQYAISCTKLSSDNVLLTVCFYDSEKTFIERVQAINFGSSTGRKSGTFTTTSGTAFIRFSTVYNSQNGGSTDFQIEFGSTATAYEPYKGNTYPIDWTDEAGTVYGCNIDPVSGVLTVECEQVTIPTSQSSWYRGYGGYYFLNSRYYSSSDNRAKYAKCNLLNIKSGHSGTELGFFPSSNEFYFEGLSNIGVTTFSDWLSWIQTNSLVIVAPLATPLTFQLSENQIATFLGTNNFWNNGNGTIDLEYRADTKLYIENLTKPSEDDMTANANIASGKFFMIGNRLFLSTTSIAQGEQIVVGTNCTELSLADALNTINA